MSWAVLDLETTINTSFKRKANPFDPRNWVVLMGWQLKDGPLSMHRMTAESQWHMTERFINILSKSTLLVGANIKFDLLHILKDAKAHEAWMDWVAGGGNVWDVQLAEYLLDGQAQSSHMLSLDELAVRYGEDTKVDEVKLLWEAGVPTEEIDPGLLARYLIGEDLVDPLTKQPTGRRREGDIGNTRNIFLKQVAKARASGQLRSILMNMGSLLCTVEMEKNGMFVDKAMGLELAAEVAEKLTAARAELEQYLPKDLPFEFSWTNRYHLSPLIFGGTVNYDAYEWDLAEGGVSNTQPAQGAGVYVQKDEVCYIMNDGSFLPVELVDANREAAHEGGELLPVNAEKYKGGKNAGEYKTKKVKVNDLTKPKGRACKLSLVFPGYTKPEAEWESATPGLYSVAADVIEVLAVRKGVPFLTVLTSVITMQKDLGTYFITTDEKTGEQKGMLTLVQPDSIIHHMLNHTSTVTGRFSSSNPNLQNIPKGNKSAVKNVFVSRFGSEGSIVQSDFSSLEIYVQAILTHCVNLITDLKAGIDLHCMRLALKEHMEYGEVFALCKGENALPEWDYKRTGAKEFSFQKAYGAGNKAIALTTGLPLEEVEALSEAEEKRYPELKVHFEKLIGNIKKNRKPTSVTVPHPDNSAIMCQLGISRVGTPDGKLYTYRESPSMSFMLKRGELASFSPTEAKNYSVQGTGGEWMKAAMWLMVRTWYARRNFNGDSLLVNTVHDAAYSDSKNTVRDEAGALMSACMEAASDFMEFYFTWTLPLPVPTDTVYGVSMAVENKFTGPAFKARVSELRTGIRASYMNGYKPSYLS